jgi:hypothetical protein
MENLLLLCRFEATDHHRESTIGIFTQPARQGRHIEAPAGGLEGARNRSREEILTAGFEGLDEADIEMQRHASVPGIQTALMGIDPENPFLLDRLGRAAAAEFRRPVRADGDQRPKAKYPAPRSSKCRQIRTSPAASARHRVSIKAALRAPAQMTYSRIPAAMQRSTSSIAGFHAFTRPS